MAYGLLLTAYCFLALADARLGVYLRSLQLAGIVNIDALPLGEDVEYLCAAFPVSIAGRFCAAER